MGIGPEMVRAWALEAEELFVGRRVARIEGTERTLSIHFAGAKAALLFSWDPERYGCCLVDAGESGDLRRRRERIPPLEATLKAHIGGARLDAARRLRWDRILCLVFRRRIGAGIDLVRSLLFEATGRYANLLLLDEAGQILEAVKHVPPTMNRTRTILPGNRYAPPPGIRGERPREAAEALREGEPLPPLRGIGRGARLLLERWGEIPGATPGDLAALLDRMEGEDEGLLPGGISPEEGTGGSEGAEADRPGRAPKVGTEEFRFFLLGGDPIALPFSESSPLMALPEVARTLLPGRCGLEVMRSAILAPMAQGRRERLRGSLLEGLDQRITLLDRKIDEGRRRGEEEILRHRLLGEALIASMHLLPPRARSARLEIAAPDGTGTQEVEIEWEPGRSPSSVAQDHFARYRRLREKREVQLLHLRRAEEERAFLAEERVFLENAETEEELRLLAEEILGARSERAGGKGGTEGRAKGGKGKKSLRGGKGSRKSGASDSAEAAQPYRRYDRGEAILYLGTSAKGNRQVVFRLARPEDWWFHTADAPGGHVILRTEEQEPEEELLRIAASLAADHGKLRNERTVRVDATLRKNVRSIPQAGPADVTYRDFRSFFVDPAYWRGRIEGPR